jgi:hypothetical protein
MLTVKKKFPMLLSVIMLIVVLLNVVAPEKILINSLAVLVKVTFPGTTSVRVKPRQDKLRWLQDFYSNDSFPE